jgi:squalene-associated FAD-dependent desaturase
VTDRAVAGGAGKGVTHVVGAGISGLACAVRLAKAGRAVAVYEGADHGGGRCRSFVDAELGRVIDNGNHLLLSGNDAALTYLEEIGARDSLVSPPRAVFPFVDLRTGERWTVRPNRGRIPWWILSPGRRIPGTRAGEYLDVFRLRFARLDATVADCFDPSRPIFERFWRPLAVAALNIPAEEGAARLLWPVVALTFGRGEAASRPCVARDGLSASFVDPAVALLRSLGCDIRFSCRLRELEASDGRVRGLCFADGDLPLSDGDDVVLALPPAGVARLLPEIRVPEKSRAIVNFHVRLEAAPPPLPGGSSLLGIVGGAAEWLFLRGDVASVTVSAAERLAQADAREIAARVWPEVVRALDLPAPPGGGALPPHRVVKERRATFAQTPAALSRRPKTRTRFANLFLAGDWTDTGLPATIEGAVRSGYAAAKAVAGG